MSWMPVKKQLPPLNASVLVTIRHRNENVSEVDACTYEEVVDQETGEIIRDFFYDGYPVNNDNTEVIAWDLMPRPYKPPFRVIVAGSRTFDDYRLLERKLDKIFAGRKPDAIVCGEAKGADMLGLKYAVQHGIPTNHYPAEWKKHGKQAGYIRNEEMADNAEALAAFWDGKSAGTKHMIDTARKKGLQVRVINYLQEKETKGE